MREFDIQPSPRRSLDQIEAGIQGYATGNWTPRIGHGNDETGVTYSQQDGTWIKLGRLVTVFFAITLTNKGTGTGGSSIRGFPFNARPDQIGAGGGMTYWVNMTETGNKIRCMHLSMAAVQSFAGLRHTTSANNDDGPITEFNFTNTSSLRGNIAYESLE